MMRSMVARIQSRQASCHAVLPEWMEEDLDNFSLPDGYRIELIERG
jgi:hypothetical protein